MWRLWNNVTAGSKVFYDKTSDYFNYYTSWGDEEMEKDIVEKLESLQQDKIDDYNSVITVDKYNKEDNGTRLMPEVSYYEAFSYFWDNPTHVVDNIYLGSAYNAAYYDTLTEFNIKVIINVTKEISNYYPDNFIYIKYNLYDNNKHSIEKYLEKAYNDIKYHQENTEGNILIHCYMGASRSASVVIYYLMRTKKRDDGTPYTFDDALKFLKEKRPIVNPTFRFTKDLAKSIYPMIC